MIRPPFAGRPDVLDRRVLFAVELIDPITHAIVSQGVTVTAPDMQAKPIVSRSGRFVWLVEHDAWPTTITVEPGFTAYAPHTQPAPPRPTDILAVSPAQRLARIVLRPTAAYPFETGATVVRGTLRERVDILNAPVVPEAIVQLAWLDTLSGDWTPDRPQAGQVWPTTGPNGEFAALLQLNAPPPADPDLDRGLLKVRVQVTRGPATRATPDTFPFLPSAADAGRVPEGRLLPSDVTLGWNELTPI
jgi:hypothetical protein